MDARESWRIDPDRSNLTFRLTHARLGEILGRFGCWGGRVVVDPARPDRPRVWIWVELSSIETGSRERDDEILKTELFEHPWEPALEFDGDRLEVGPAGGLRLLGWLSLRAARTAASIELDAPLLDVDPAGRPRFVCSAHASIGRKALGLHRRGKVEDWLSDRLLGDEIELVAHLEAARDGGPSGLALPDALRSRVAPAEARPA
jgi:polyisoprenoid-binding protein YceI